MSFPGFNECHGHFANEAGSEAASPRAGTVLPETWCQTLHVLKPIRMLLAYCWNHSSPLLGSIVVRGMKQISYVNCEFPKWFWVPWAFCRPLLPSFVIVTQREAARRLGLDWAVTVGLVALKIQCSPKYDMLIISSYYSLMFLHSSLCNLPLRCAK